MIMTMTVTLDNGELGKHWVCGSVDKLSTITSNYKERDNDENPAESKV